MALFDEPGRRRSQLQSMIDRSCEQFRPQPDLGLNLEICDHINQKKANTPREAAFEILRHVNGRITHSSMLALSLLDICVKNCGYPFHLQISTKDFLNELVRRFPERPPPISPPPMSKILELIHEWKATICVTSKHREDLVHIRDMHRLLSYKGYRFPDYDRRAAAVLNPQESIRSADELEEEDREAQAAKLQELIRRGGPKDLAAAQELMKIMAGAEPERKPDYGKQSQKDINAIRQRVLLLNEMLNNAKPDERFVEGDAFDQLAAKCRTVRVKLQKLITELDESDAAQADDLLSLNDLINAVLNRYDAFRKGDRTSTVDISIGAEGISKLKSKAPEASLIDFDEAVPDSAETVEDSLAGLSLGQNAPTVPRTHDAGYMSGLPSDLLGGVFGAPANGSSPSPSFPASIRLGSGPPTPTFTSRPATMQMPVSAINNYSRPLTTTAAAPVAAPKETKKDPFADLF